MCGNEWRWRDLVDDLLHAQRLDEAIQALDEMDRRGFELKPSKLSPETSAFMGSKAFMSSDVGKRLQGKSEGVSARRLDFQKRLAAMSAQDRPPEKYVAKDACPFECCAYKAWTVDADTELMDAPDGKKIVGRAVRGTKATGVTGEVRLKPVPLGVVFDHSPFAKGDIFFQLDDMGEGMFHYWHRGKVGELDLSPEISCLKPSPDCWAELVFPDDRKDASTWWVKVKLADGTTGWTDRADNFGSKDACGY